MIMLTIDSAHGRILNRGKYEGVHKVEDNGEVFRLRWQLQRDLFCVPSCSAMANVRKHPFSWTDMFK